jgi:hypothetical protein
MNVPFDEVDSAQNFTAADGVPWLLHPTTHLLLHCTIAILMGKNGHVKKN